MKGKEAIAMRKAIFSLALLVFFSTSDLFASTQKAVVRWSYPAGVTNLSGFKIYVGSRLASNIPDPLARTCEISVDIAVDSKLVSVSAYDSSGNEGLPSKTFLIFVPSTPKNLRLGSAP